MEQILIQNIHLIYKKIKIVCPFYKNFGDKHSMGIKNIKGGVMSNLIKNLKWSKWITNNYGLCYAKGYGLYIIKNNKTWVKGYKIL